MFKHLVSQAKIQVSSDAYLSKMNPVDKTYYITYAPVIAMTINQEIEVESVSALRGVTAG